MHGNELNKNFVRILIGQKKLYAYIVEITKVYDTVYKRPTNVEGTDYDGDDQGDGKESKADMKG